MVRGIRAFSPHQQKTGAGNSETPCETEETAPPWEQNRNILSFSESWMKVEVLSSEAGILNLSTDRSNTAAGFGASCTTGDR